MNVQSIYHHMWYSTTPPTSFCGGCGMSTKALFHAFDLVKTRPDLSCHEKITLLVLADYTNRDTSRAWVSVDNLAAEASISKRTAQRAIRGLEEKGIVTVEPRPNKTSIYRMVWGDSQSSEGVAKCQSDTSRGDCQAHDPLNDPINSEQEESLDLPLLDLHKNQHCAKQASTQVDLEKEFEEGFWPRYRKHRPGGKQNAKKEYIKARKTGASAEDISRGLTFYEAMWKREGTEDSKKPWAERFLKWGRYKDAGDTAAPKTKRLPSLDEIQEKLPDLYERYQNGHHIVVNGWTFVQGSKPWNNQVAA